MRFIFPSTLNAKKASKELSKLSGQSLSACRETLAKASGYRDWHELEQLVGHEMVSNIELEANIIAAISQKLELNAGSIQHIFATQRLFGNANANPERAVTLRAKVYEQTEIPPAKAGEPGYVCQLNVSGRKKETVILRKMDGNSLKLINQNSITFYVVRQEVTFQRDILPFFIPQRFWMPYGKWIETDGSEVLFSRDYFPLWRIQPQKSPERIHPNERIHYEKQEWFWQEGDEPWNSVETYELCIKLLADNNIRSTPQLADYMSGLLNEKNLREICSTSDIQKLF